jgi:6-phosphofructokinase
MTPQPSTSSPIRTIGLLTGGGDCPGLNAVIRAVAMDAIRRGIKVVGIEDGLLGLIQGRARPLADDDVRTIINQGGTILGSCNKSNPSRFAVGKDAEGKPIFADVTDRCLDTIRRLGLDALVLAGGDGTLAAAASLIDRGVNCIALPKTIDNDIWGTDLSFGFLTAVQTATDAIDKVRTTAASHHRVMVVEVMGRNAGWLALHAGIASGSHAILIPEIPFDLARLAGMMTRRAALGRRFSIVCAAEGACPIGGAKSIARVDPTSPDPIRLGGLGRWLAESLESATGIESRYVVLGHVQRGGPPIAADRVLATQLGHHAALLLAAGARDRLVVYKEGRTQDIDIREPAGRQRLVPIDHPLIAAAKSVGAVFGDEGAF